MGEGAEGHRPRGVGVGPEGTVEESLQKVLVRPSLSEAGDPGRLDRIIGPNRTGSGLNSDNTAVATLTTAVAPSRAEDDLLVYFLTYSLPPFPPPSLT